VTAGSSPVSVTVDPTNQFAYVANSVSGNVSVLNINPITGALTPSASSPVAVGSAPSAVTVEPTGRFAYVTNSGTNNISMFTIAPATGGLTPISGVPATIPAGSSPSSITVDLLFNKYVYVTNSVTNNVSVFTIDQTTNPGALIAGTPVNVGTTPVSVTVDPVSRYAYVVNSGSRNISVFNIDPSTGDLGKLTYITPPPPAPSLSYSFAQGVAVQTIDAGGATPTSISIDPRGAFAYVTHTGGVLMFTIDQSTGVLTAGATLLAGTNPSSVSVDPSGSFVYVTNSVTNNISVFTIDHLTGALTSTTPATVTTGSNPSSITTNR
jgi:6-phosphogluconolactonase (cycloisomerase 2 family)